MSGNNKGWYWTPARLQQLKKVLKGAAVRDRRGWYFGPIGLASYAAKHGKKEGLNISLGQANNGVQILVFLGGVEAGMPGAKAAGSKRRFFPGNIQQITDDDIIRYRASRGVKAPLPRAR